MCFRYEINPLKGEGGEEQLELALGKCKVSSIQEKHPSELRGSAEPAFGQELLQVSLSPQQHRHGLSWPLVSHATLECYTHTNRESIGTLQRVPAHTGNTKLSFMRRIIYRARA